MPTTTSEANHIAKQSKVVIFLYWPFQSHCMCAYLKIQTQFYNIKDCTLINKLKAVIFFY
jgi:hypothetical protein